MKKHKTKRTRITGRRDDGVPVVDAVAPIMELQQYHTSLSSALRNQTDMWRSGDVLSTGMQTDFRSYEIRAEARENVSLWSHGMEKENLEFCTILNLMSRLLTMNNQQVVITVHASRRVNTWRCMIESVSGGSEYATHEECLHSVNLDS